MVGFCRMSSKMTTSLASNLLSPCFPMVGAHRLELWTR